LAVFNSHCTVFFLENFYLILSITMKTYLQNPALMRSTLIRSFLLNAMLLSAMLLSPAFAQDSTQQPAPSQPIQSQSAPQTFGDSGMETLFGEKAPFVFVPTLKTTTLGDKWGTMLGIHGGALINKSILVGLGTYWSFSNTSINMGYTGLIVEYRYMPHRLIHVGGSLLAGYGGASSTYRGGVININPLGVIENIGRLFSPQFFVLEPSAFGEVNLNSNLSASLGASYRFVTGLPETLSSSATGLTNQGLSGVAINVGMRFRIE
jgi:hypothetical protein